LDLTRKRSQVQTLSRPPRFSLVKDPSAPSRPRSSRAAAALRPQAAPPPNPVALPSRTTRDHHEPNDHAAWSPPLGQAHGRAPATCPGWPAGAGEHLLRPMLPGHPAGTLALDQRPRSGPAAKRRPWAPVNPHASQPRPTPHHPPSRQARCRQATTPPADHGGTSTRCARPSGPPHRATPGSSAARTARRQRRGHRRPVRPDTWMPRTPGHRTPGHRMSARPVGRTSHGGPDEADRATTGPGRRPDILATGDHPLGGPTSPGSRRLGALGHPGRLRGDGTCAAALTAVTGQLPSTARHEAAPRRTAVLG
jgi:hypothetical protein